MDTTIARSIAHAAQQMHLAGTVNDTLEVIVRSAAEALPTFDHIGISTIENGGDILTRAATSEMVHDLDAIQYSLHEGPCVASLDGHDVITAPDIAHDARWPNYIPQALPHGLKAQLAVRLHLNNQGTVGGLNLYSTTSADIADEDVAIAAFFATHATLALSSARHAESLDEAILTRQRIGQALGILMERYEIDETAAQAFLWRASSHGNVKVRDIAATLVDEANRRDLRVPS